MRFFAEKTAKYRCFLHRNILFPQCNHLNTLALKVHNLKLLYAGTVLHEVRPYKRTLFSFTFLSKHFYTVKICLLHRRKCFQLVFTIFGYRLFHRILMTDTACSMKQRAAC